MGRAKPWARSTRQVLNAAAAFLLLRVSLASEANVVLVTLTPFWLMQLLKAAMAEAVMVPPPVRKPLGAYFWHALNAAELAPVRAPPKPPLGKAVGNALPDGNARGEKDAPGEKDPRARGVIFTPCCFRQVWNALSPADWVALALLLALGLLDAVPPPPQPTRARHATTTGSAQRRRG